MKRKLKRRQHVSRSIPFLFVCPLSLGCGGAALGGFGGVLGSAPRGHLLSLVTLAAALLRVDVAVGESGDPTGRPEPLWLVKGHPLGRSAPRGQGRWGAGTGPPRPSWAPTDGPSPPARRSTPCLRPASTPRHWHTHRGQSSAGESGMHLQQGLPTRHNVIYYYITTGGIAGFSLSETFLHFILWVLYETDCEP